MVPWTTQFGVLLERSFKEQMRQRGVHITQLVQAIIIAVLVGTVFLQIGTTQSSVVRRQPVLFFCVINQVGGWVGGWVGAGRLAALRWELRRGLHGMQGGSGVGGAVQ
jgi:hypothetical protein